MKKKHAPSAASRSKGKPGSKGGKRSLYNPELGASNYRKAEDGRFAYHPAFRACKNVAGAFVALERMNTNPRHIKLTLPAVTRQLDKALCILRDEADKFKSPSDKLRFAEAMAAFFNPPKGPDEDVRCVCWRAIQMRTRLHEDPSQAELRHAVQLEDRKIYSDQQWKRLMKRTGLNKKLRTHREKTLGIKLRKV